MIQDGLVKHFNVVPLNHNLVSDRLWASRPSAVNPLNTFMLDFFSNVTVQNVNDQSMVNGLSARIFQKFGPGAKGAVDDLKNKFIQTVNDLQYFVLDFDELNNVIAR